MKRQTIKSLKSIDTVEGIVCKECDCLITANALGSSSTKTMRFVDFFTIKDENGNYSSYCENCVKQYLGRDKK